MDAKPPLTCRQIFETSPVLSAACMRPMLRNRRHEYGFSAEASEWRRKHCWSPNQLRHTRATELREQFGIEAAQVVLGHSDPKTTLVYAEAQFSKAAAIARETGWDLTTPAVAEFQSGASLNLSNELQYGEEGNEAAG